MTNTKTPQVAATTECMSAVLIGQLNEAEISALTKDPKAFVQSKTNVTIADNISVTVKQNDANTVHLALPYYGSIEDISAEVMKDSELSQTTGGEILISIIIGGLVGAGIAGAVGGTATIGIVSTAGVIGAVVGATVGGVAGTAATAAVAGGAAYAANKNSGK